MRIAICSDIAYSYAIGAPSAKGGAEKAQWLLGRALARTGWDVVVAVRDYLAPRQQEIVDGVRFVGLERTHYVRAWSSFLRNEKPDWWYWRGSDPLWGALLLTAKMRGVHGIFATAFDRDVQPRTALVRRPRWWPLYAWGLHAVDRIFVQHRGQFCGLNRLLQPKTDIIPGIVPLGESVIPLARRGGYVAWVAMLRHHKRPDVLLEIARATPEVRYVVCGGTTTFATAPEYAETVLRQLKSLPNIDYRGQLAPSRVLDIIGNAAALLSTSDDEGFPNTFLEAWSAGTPIITVKVDPGGVIRERGLGIVSGSTSKTIDDIRTLLNAPAAFEMLSIRGRKYVQDVHSEAAVAEAFNKTILAPRRERPGQTRPN